MINPLREVKTDKAPEAIGPYSQAIIAGDFMFLSGQIALDPATGEFVEGGVEEQTTQVIDNIEAVLAAEGAGLDKVARVDVFLTDMKDYAAINKVYASRFTAEQAPARGAVAVKELPRRALVELVGIAYLGK